jgi:HJR/Mrr/RecB family endonuclease
VFPILWARYNVPPEYKIYRQQVRAIDADYQQWVIQYNWAKWQNEFISLSDLLRMHPQEFERHIAFIFEKMGYNVLTTGQTGDHA